MILKVITLAAAAAVIAISLKKYNAEFAMLAVVAAGVLIMTVLLGSIQDIVYYLEELSGYAAAGEIIKPVLKAAGISVITRVTGDFCRDCGESALAAKAELAGTVGCLTVALPLVKYAMDIISELI